MKKETLQKKNAVSVFTLLLVFLFGLSPFFIKAQQQQYESVKGALVATSDTRLMSSIYETDTTVTMIIRAVGYMKADNIAFSVFYDPSKLTFCKENFTLITQFGALQNDYAVLDQEFVTKQWSFDGLHKMAGTATTLTDYVSGHATMNAILLEIGLPLVTPSKLFVVEAGEVKNIMQFTFKKATNQLLTKSDFGLGVKTTGPVTGFYQPEFGHDGLFIWYKDRPTSIHKEVDPNVFLFRSGLHVETYLLTPPASASATINGTFWQGAVNLPVSNDILDNIGTATSGSAKLNHDMITKYGFIYTSANVTMSISDFSDSIRIENINYPVPTTTEITNGEFTRNGNTFYFIMAGNNNGAQETLPYDATISNLNPNATYYAWAYTHYHFETSKPFQAVGNRITFTTTDCMVLNIGTVYTVENPLCNGNNGKIQMYVTGGTGNYLFSVNEGPFTSYTDDIITGLTAGTYTIAVKDASQLACDSTVIHNVVLHNSNTDLNVTLTAKNATTCDGFGSLFVTVTGGTGNYTYLLNGTTPDMANGWITNLPVGEYELKVTDAGNQCVASSGIVYIYADDSQLAAQVTVTTHATCTTPSGTVEFTVTGAKSNTFTYQLNGSIIELVENYDGMPIVFSGLGAGIHYLHITDSCKQIVEKITITNGNNEAFAFTATPHNETLTCSGALLSGSITLSIEYGVSPFEFSINGSDWEPLVDATIPALHNGTYRIQLRDETGCTYEENQVTIGRDVHTPVSITTVLVYQEPTCNNTNGKIQVFAQGGSGSYKYSTNGTDFDPYTDGIITGLTAGTYTIWVRDANDNTCGEPFVSNIVLHNGNTGLTVSVETENAPTCNTNGKLMITTTGGSGNFTYYIDNLNGTPETLVDGYILRPAGAYVVYVVDNDDDCLASSGEARIHATSSTLAVNVVPSVTTICGSSTGVATVTVSGLNSTPYTYQLNGNAEVVENAASFTLAGLGAGRHFLRITDNCDEVTTEFFISNEGTNPFKVTAIAQNELLDCSGALTPGSITLTATSGAPVFEYRIDGGTWVSFATNGQTETINGLSSGIYLVEVRDANGCTYQVNHVTIERETSFDLDITSPVAVSPQTFCNNATVAHLQATGVDIKWYLTAEGGYPLAATTVLLHDSVYYAAQSVGFCQSQVRTAVKVYIDPNAVLDTPNIVTPQHFCNNASATPMLGCIATDGNTNIVWYASLTSDVELPLTTILEDNTTYYAALVAGDCQTSPRLAVQVFIDQTVPTAPVIVEHQYFCSGALIANIAVPNNQIVWYISTTDDTPLAETHQLEDGKTYYAAQKAGTCESARTPVTIHLGAPSAPNAPTPQFICGKQTLADINITGSGIVWYDAQTNGNQLPATTPLVAGETYWAAQSSGNCEGERIGITISDACYEIHGTVFPFVYWNNDVDTLFKVTARLYNVPTAGGDPVDAILASNPVHSVTATYYDGSTYIAGTPKDPGAMGSVNNPGKKISWEKLGKTVGTVDNTPVAPGEVPVKAVGMYTFKNVVPGTYILEISRQGFLTRWAKVTITQNGMTLGHREILAGEFNDDFAIRLNDISILNANFAETDAENYNAKFDVDGSLDVNAHDVDILLFNQGAFLNIYLETEEWINGN